MKVCCSKILVFMGVVLCTLFGLCACETPFRADVTAFVTEAPADSVYELNEDARLQLPPREMSNFDYLGGTAVTNLGCFPMM